MEISKVLRLSNMKGIYLAFFIFITSFLYGQNLDYKYPILADELNNALRNELVRGDRLRFSFSIDSLGNIKVFNFEDLNKKNELLDIIRSTNENLSVGFYKANVYWDLYSSQVYSVISEVEGEQGFPNYDLYYAEPAGGRINYIKSFKSDLERELGRLDSIDSYKWLVNDWTQGIDVLIDSKGNASYLSKNPLIELLDSTKMIKWNPALYYGRPRKSIMSFRPSYYDFKNIARSDIQWKYEVFYLDRQFKDDIVRFEEEPKEMPQGKLVISLILNPLTDKFENPFIHRGDIKEGEELIAWIGDYDFSNLRFYWYPEAKRIYFYT
ncbi:MAG: hypothetical protein ACI35V_03855 [Sphingobacterium composti]